MSDDRVPPHPLDARWHLKVGTEKYGPYTGHEIKDFIAQGRVTAASMMADNPFGPWHAVAEDEVLRNFLPPRPPRSTARSIWHGTSQVPGLVVAAHVAYGLLLLGGLITWMLLPLAGLIVAYVGREDARDTWLESHFTWQIHTFWYSFALGILYVFVFGLAFTVGRPGGAASFIVIGLAIMAVTFAWVIYRCVKGWVRLGNERAVE